jgi:antitoxin component YwqK of YwqJK toxin-antitoxin module
MLKNFRALFKPGTVILFFLLVLGGSLFAQEESVWYRSNASGLAIELIPSAFAALRNEYSLEIRKSEGAPDLLLPYYESEFLIESRLLYEKGELLRQQWIFRDENGATRLNASGSHGLFSRSAEEGEIKTGFVELFDRDRFITEERQFFDDGSESIFRFFYNEGTLLKTETWFKNGEVQAEDEINTELIEAPEPAVLDPVLMTTDYYRYTRSHSLRTIERVYHSDVAGGEKAKIGFPGISPGFSRGVEFVNPSLAYSSEFFDDILITAGTKVTFTTDDRGRVLTETRKDEEGNLIGEIKNTWTGDRLDSVSWKSGDDERTTQYEYDPEGNRTMEKDYRGETLERTVRSQGNREVEELYMNGAVILRAIWEDGRKISEERVRPQAKK